MSSIHKKQHYNLFCARVLFSENQDAPAAEAYFNVPIVTDHPFVTAKDIARSQQAVQMLLMKRTGPVIIHDVCTVSVSRLGLMTEKEFTAGLESLVNEQRELARA